MSNWSFILMIKPYYSYLVPEEIKENVGLMLLHLLVLLHLLSIQTKYRLPP